MHLILDVGNTRIKAAVYKDSELVHLEIFTNDSCADGIIEIIKKYNCLNGIISSVGELKKSELIKIRSEINLFELSPNSKVPFFNNYSTPKTLGVDRIALAASAITNFSNTNTLVIDAGTCITFDFVNKEGFYLGGAISPGLKMRYKAMHDYTAKLPLLNISESHELIGDSTESSMHSGVINGVINEIDGAINAYRKKNQDLTVVLTGGDVNFLSNKLKNSIFANPNFLLEGLNTILTYNL